MDATSTFGQWLKQRRQSLDLTQEAVAEAVNCSIDLIRKIESGRRRPSRQVAVLLARCLHVPPNDTAAFLQWARSSASETASPPGETETDTASFSGHPDATTTHSSIPNTHSPIPAAPTYLIGRERELSHVRDLLWRSTTRMVTLTGPPGIGKTRLAMAVASMLRDDFKDGLVYISLSALEDPAQLPATLTAGLGIRESGNRPLLQALQDALRDKQMLLVLDNFEQIVEAAPVITGLLAAAPQLKVLVTSRAPLHLRGEKLVDVPPLELPDAEHLPPLADLERIESVALFIERAADAQDGFAITPDNASMIAAICNRLDGLPLAIELAAAKTRLLSLPALLRRLEHRLTLLTGGPRDAPLHQQTLRRSIESSYALLSDEEQALFRKLGIFVGPFTFDAAEEVTELTLEQLEAILDQSLLHRLSSLEVDSGGEVRFSMLASIREYAREQLEAHEEMQPAAHSHARYHLALALAAQQELIGLDQKLWMPRLAASYADLRSAFDWALKNAEPAITLQIAASIWRFWYNRGELSEGRRWLEEALAQGSDQPSDLRARVLHALGTIAERQTDLAAAERYLSESVELRRTLGNKLDFANTINNLGIVSYAQGNIDKADALFAEALDLFEEMGDKDGEARTRGNVSMVAYHRGDYPKVTSILEKTVAMRRELRGQGPIASALSNLSLVLLLQGDYERAIAYAEEGVALNNELGDTLGVAFCLANLGWAARKLGDLERARSILAQSLSIFWKMGDKHDVAGCLHRLGNIAARTGQPARAARLFGASEALNEAIGVPVDPPELPDYQEGVALARDTLSEVEFNAAWAIGRSMPLDDAVSYALAPDRTNQ